jgi:fumarate reductase flavoprotein subunit
MNYKITEQKESDIVVIGGGGAGMVAAARAAWLLKRKIVVLEKSGHTGGGALMAKALRTFDSKWQRDRGVPDVTNQFIIDGMDRTYWKLDHRLVADCIRATGQYFDWFCGLGDDIEDKFVVDFYIFDGPNGPQVPLLKNSFVNVTGKYMMETMRDLCDKRGVDILTKHSVVDVEVNNGEITAVIAAKDNGYLRVTCKVCILASGSWIGNKKIMKKVAPIFLQANIAPSPHFSSDYTGDGIELAEKAGAFVDYNSFCLRPLGPRNTSKSEVMNTMGHSPFSIMVNLNGKRWVCEPPQVRGDIFFTGHLLMDQPEGMTYSIFDENTLCVAIDESKKVHEGWGGYYGFPKFPETMEEVHANIDKAFEGSNIDAFRADTVEELAQQIGVPSDVLKTTIAVYDASCKDGVDWEYFKPAKDLVPLNKSPYYAVRGHLSSDGAFGGVLVNHEMQAYKQGGGLVEGLYVIGDFASGRHINMSGVKIQVINDCSWAFAGGFIAANSAVKYLGSL